MDRFNNILDKQTLSVGMEKLKPSSYFPLLVQVLRAIDQTIEGIYRRNDRLCPGPGGAWHRTRRLV